MLENEGDYKRLNLEQERGPVIAGDLGEFLNATWNTLRVLSDLASRLSASCVRSITRLKVAGDAEVKHLLSVLSDKEFAVEAKEMPGSLLARADVPPDYLETRKDNRDDVTLYLTESRRRAGIKDKAGAIRALSSVVEVHPGRSDALRLVGYRLLDLGEPGQAARLFAQVQHDRPFEPHSYRDFARAWSRTATSGWRPSITRSSWPAPGIAVLAMRSSTSFAKSMPK